MPDSKPVVNVFSAALEEACTLSSAVKIRELIK